jgi:hypothetical protein
VSSADVATEVEEEEDDVVPEELPDVATAEVLVLEVNAVEVLPVSEETDVIEDEVEELDDVDEISEDVDDTGPDVDEDDEEAVLLPLHQPLDVGCVAKNWRSLIAILGAPVLEEG